MLDIRLIREKPDFVKEQIAKLGEEAPIDEIVQLDIRRRQILTDVERMRAERNEGSREIGRKPAGPEREAQIAAMRELGDRIAALDEELKEVDQKLEKLLLNVPNLPDPDVPVGKDDSENVNLGEFGEMRAFDFEPRPHWELGEELDIIDFERGVKISGSRFYILKGDGARLQRALITWFLDVHRTEHGYTEVYPPALVRTETLIGTGQIPKFEDAQYKTTTGDHWLIPTAEVPVTNMYANEIFEEAQLPIYHCAYSPCFRREQFSAGRDVRGIKRGHQFDKVEVVKFVHPDTSNDELYDLVEKASSLLAKLGLPYRHIQMCTGDLSFVAAKKIDIEVWAPGCGEWLEVSSCSNFRDFQARRAGIRFRPEQGSSNEFVHTLNGSALALPRTMIAVMETYQNADGSITIPEVLRPYMDGQEVITRA
ncbi:MAG TPA: serine--tRNA ligase [Thermomicrobiales bacterium]|nr:serine--tRNA ligase [Thermomicrobiales bacterium]